jgi:hypothetical protein
LSENFAWELTWSQVQESVPTSHANRQKGNEDSQENRQDSKIDDSCNNPNPESRMAQRRN